MSNTEKCVAGCRSFEGGELKHDKNCVFYDGSLSSIIDNFDKEKIDFAIDILKKLGKSTSLTSATMMLEIEIHKLKQLDNDKETT